MRREITLNLNGELKNFEADDTAPLLDVLRGAAGLTGSRFGCGAEQCGACAVLINGEDKPSCTVEVGACEGKTIVTIEGLGSETGPHVLQTAFLEKQAGQCGYCLSGMIIGAKALLDRNPNPTRDEIAGALAWHLCRCGAHNRILEAVALAAERLRQGASV
ncbi:MAG: (2Fe-2S)-binding protein [Caulobacteraceae bacterium]